MWRYYYDECVTAQHKSCSEGANVPQIVSREFKPRKSKFAKHAIQVRILNSRFALWTQCIDVQYVAEARINSRDTIRKRNRS